MKRRSSALIPATVATSLGTLVAVSLAAAPASSAAPSCTSTTPAVDQVITCTYNDGGVTDITVPSGADTMTVTVDGAGGGGGGVGNVFEGATGGTGARVVATLDVQGISQVRVALGTGGSGGSGSTTAGGIGQGGGGGGYSAVFRGASNVATDVLVVAGGGGGGAGGRTPDSSSGVGGDGAALGSSAGGSGAGPGGGGGADGTGAGGSSKVDPGGAWLSGDGAGGAGSDTDGGNGGDGYGGGGEGGTEDGGGGAGGSFADSTLLIGSATFSAEGGDGGEGGNLGNGLVGAHGALTVTFTIRAIPSPSSPQSSTPNVMTLNLTLPAGVRCDFGNIEASVGSWIQLPDAQDCVISQQSEGSTPSLLGWATRSDFPVAIAQRQVDNGWGAYETYNDDGQLTSVFIPAGGFTAISGPTNLFPIMK